MNCLKNIDRISFSPELVKTLTNLYTFKGKDFYYEKELSDYMKGIVQETIEKDTIYAGKIFGLNVKDTRERLVVMKDSEPKTKDEKILANLKKIFKIIQENGSDLIVDSNEFLKLAVMLFKDVSDVKFNTEIVTVQSSLIPDKRSVSKRDTLSEALKLYIDIINGNKMEYTQAITNLYIDLLHLDIFSEKNDFISLLIAYCLLFRAGFKVFKQVSFFELYYNNLKEFEVYTAEAGFKYEVGFSDTEKLNRKLIEIMIDGYKNIEVNISRKNFDHQTGKKDTVMSAIMHLPQTFTKEDVKRACPKFSDSTVQRALIELRDNGKIKPNGTGRSATWTKIVPDEQFSSRLGQMTIEDVLESPTDYSIK